MPFARRKQCNARKSTNIPYCCRRCRKSPHITPCGKASRHCISTNSRPKHSVSCAKGQKQGPENGAVTETLNKQLFLNLPYVLNNSENTPELSMNSKGTQRSQAFVLHSIFCTPRHISPAESTDRRIRKGTGNLDACPFSLLDTNIPILPDFTQTASSFLELYRPMDLPAVHTHRICIEYLPATFDSHSHYPPDSWYEPWALFQQRLTATGC